jgi:hypothetical protein
LFFFFLKKGGDLKRGYLKPVTALGGIRRSTADPFISRELIRAMLKAFYYSLFIKEYNILRFKISLIRTLVSYRRWNKSIYSFETIFINPW